MDYGICTMEYKKESEQNSYHKRLHGLIDEYVHLVYRLSRQFPKKEQYGAVSQLRRAALSVMLNYIEGYARQRRLVHKNFLEISYGSLEESSYLTGFAYKEQWLKESEHGRLKVLEKEIGAMIWGILRKI